jgi:hypothetical protein
MNLPARMHRALEILAQRWGAQAVPWLLGGSCGLALHGVPLVQPPRDIDIYIDQTSMARLHACMQDDAHTPPRYSQTDQYASTLANYVIEGVVVELVAGFCVRIDGATYTVRVNDTLTTYATSRDVGGHPISLMPLAHEYIFNCMRQREERIRAIHTIASQHPEYGACFQRLLQTNTFSPYWLARMTKSHPFGTCDAGEHGWA